MNDHLDDDLVRDGGRLLPSGVLEDWHARGLLRSTPEPDPLWAAEALDSRWFGLAVAAALVVGIILGLVTAEWAWVPR